MPLAAASSCCFSCLLCFLDALFARLARSSVPPCSRSKALAAATAGAEAGGRLTASRSSACGWCRAGQGRWDQRAWRACW
jgi:hypothetical protein